MYTQSGMKLLVGLVVAAVSIMIVEVFLTPPALARIRSNTNDVVSVTIDKDRHLIVKGRTSSDPKETIVVRVTVTQRSTGALAEGDTSFTGTGDLQQFVVRAPTLQRAEFEEGPVTVVYLVHTSYRGNSTDCNQWLNTDLQLKKE